MPVLHLHIFTWFVWGKLTPWEENTHAKNTVVFESHWGFTIDVSKLISGLPLIGALLDLTMIFYDF